MVCIPIVGSGGGKGVIGNLPANSHISGNVSLCAANMTSFVMLSSIKCVVLHLTPTE